MSDPIPRGPFDQGLFLAHYNKGREHFEARRLDEAERQLEEAYLLRPRDPRVLNLLGLVYFRGEKLDKAEEVYRKLIAESPEAHTLHYNLGLICFKLGRLEDAESAFLKALELTQGNPKIHFYLGSIYERLHRYKDAIYQYRQAGANLMVQRLQVRLGPAGAGADSTAPPGAVASPPRRNGPPEPRRPTRSRPDPARGWRTSRTCRSPPAKTLRPVSPSLMAEDGPPPGLSETARFQVPDDTLPPGTRDGRRPARRRALAAPVAPPSPPRPEPAAAREVFRGLEKGLMEVDFSGKVFIKQGTIYSYSGNLTFWVKDKRAGARPVLVIVTGTGRLILTDQEREITFMQVADEPVFVEPNHLLACEEGLAAPLRPPRRRGGGHRGGRPRGAGHGRAVRREQAAAPHASSPACPCRCRPRPSSCGRASSSRTSWTTRRSTPFSCAPPGRPAGSSGSRAPAGSSSSRPPV